jgi:nucleotide sugar dehydrogenase
MRIAMIGTGYVGLVSGVCFSDFGHIVTCIDSDAAKIRQLRSGSLPIFEPGLDALVASNVEAGRLSFTTESAAAIRAADAIFPAVGTPSRRGDGFADLSYVYDAARGIAPDGADQYAEGCGQATPHPAGPKAVPSQAGLCRIARISPQAWNNAALETR